MQALEVSEFIYLEPTKFWDCYAGFSPPFNVLNPSVFFIIIINTDLQHMHVYMLMSIGVCDIKMCDVLMV